MMPSKCNKTKTKNKFSQFMFTGNCTQQIDNVDSRRKTHGSEHKTSFLTPFVYTIQDKKES